MDRPHHKIPQLATKIHDPVWLLMYMSLWLILAGNNSRTTFILKVVEKTLNLNLAVLHYLPITLLELFVY